MIENGSTIKSEKKVKSLQPKWWKSHGAPSALKTQNVSSVNN